MLIQAERLREFAADIFTAAGTSRDEGERVARYLVEANLAGHDSHGVVRVPRYVQWLKSGFIVAGVSPGIEPVSYTHLTLPTIYSV